MHHYPGINIVANASLGSSTAAMLAYRMGLLDGVDIDVLLIDLAVNEQAAAQAGLYNFGLSATILRWTLAWCVERSVSPVFLVMPLLTAAERYLFGDGHVPEALTQYRSLADEHNVRIIDGYALAQDLCGDRALRQLFDDAHHPSRELQALIARNVGRAVLEKPAKVRLNRARRVRFVPAVSMAGVRGEQVVNRTSAIVNVDLVRLEVGDRLTPNLSMGCVVVGVVFNMLTASASLSICGLTKRLDCCQPSPLALRLVAWTMSQPAIVSSFSLLECVPVDGRDAEMNEHNFHDRVLPSDPLEFAGLIVLDPKARPVRLGWRARLRRLRKSLSAVFETFRLRTPWKSTLLAKRIGVVVESLGSTGGKWWTRQGSNL